MKKSLLLGAAAMAAVVAAAPQAEASEVTVGGYYMIRFQDNDLVMNQTTAAGDTGAWNQRAQINITAKMSEKTSFHINTRFFDDQMAGGSYTQANNPTTAYTMDVMQTWLETEMYGVGVKVGSMPFNMHDQLLYKDSGGSLDAIMLSKSFGGITVLLGDIKALDPAASDGATGVGNENDATDHYLGSVLGKAGSVNYQVTYVHQDSGDQATTYTANTDNNWVAATLGTNLGGVKMTLTGIWESGLNGTGVVAGSQLEESGGYGALKVSGKTGFGGWNGYGFYSSEDYNHPLYQGGGGGHAPGFSTAWDQGGVAGRDLLQDFWTGATNANNNATQMENVWGVGLGLTVKAGAWTIKPQVDYAALVEDNVGGAALAASDDVWAGSLVATTKLDAGTTFSLIAIGATPGENGTQTAETVTDMHSLQAEFKVKF